MSPVERVGKYVSPKDWNALISDPNTVSGFSPLQLLLSSLFYMDAYYPLAF